MCKFLNGSDSKLNHSKYPPIILQNIFQSISMTRALAGEERQKLKILTTKHVPYEYQIKNVSLSIKL